MSSLVVVPSGRSGYPQTSPLRLTPKKTDPSPRKQSSRCPEPQDHDTLVLQHLSQVRLIAKKMREGMRPHVELEDLIGYGIIGLIEAVRRFDPGRGILLKTYAEHRIRGAILDGLRRMNWLSRSASRNKARCQREISENEQECFYPRTKADARGGSARRKTAASAPPARNPLLKIVCAVWNLEDLEQISEGRHWRATSHRAVQDPASQYERIEQADLLAQAVARLPPRKRLILEMYYQRELTMEEIGQILHVHQSRISQLHTGAIRFLRSYLCSGEAGIDVT